jgi:hypothetical protein
VTDLPDFDLHRTTSDSDLPMPPARPVGIWIAVALLVVAAGAAAYVAFWRRPRPACADRAPSRRRADRVAAAWRQGDAITLPPLDASDTLVRTLVQGLTESSAVMAAPDHRPDPELHRRRRQYRRRADARQAT